MRITLGLVACAPCLGLFGCEKNTLPPLMGSSAGQSVYAVSYPDKLGALRGDFASQENRIGQLKGEISTFADGIETGAWEHVIELYELSEEDGRTEDFAERFDQNDQVATFFDDEKEKLTQSVAGNVGYVAKQKECKDPNEIAGTAVVSMKKSVDKQLTERLRSHGEASVYLLSHTEALGPKATEKLRDQIDKLSELAYLAHVGLERTRRRLQTMLEQSSEIRSTLERVSESADRLVADETQPPGDRKAAEVRSKLARASLAKLDSEVSQARTVSEQWETKHPKLRDEVDQAFEALIEAAEKKAALAQK